MSSGQRNAATLREDALAIWRAGVDAVDSARLVQESVEVAGDQLRIVDEWVPLEEVARIFVVGAGKAGAGMARGLLAAIGDDLSEKKSLQGWINVPADCVADCGRITLHSARPAGVNEPTVEGVAGTDQILRLLARATAEDLVVCLLSGGGSALLPAPLEGVSLADKQHVTRLLSSGGANIEQLNTVRKQLSRVKGGRLAAACSARLRTLIISDVIGDPLDVIASGPTVADTSTAADALAVLDALGLLESAPVAVVDQLKTRQGETATANFDHVRNHVIGNNAVAVDSAGMEAERRGYSHAMIAASTLEGPAEAVGEHLAKMAIRMRSQAGPDCLITGGEPTVSLAAEAIRGRGGRNQQLVLAAADYFKEHDASRGVVVLSGGTDGEDGPTDAAGGWIGEPELAALTREQLASALHRNDAYTLLAQCGGLLKTGPTHTNVCDLRVVVVDRVQPQPK